MMKFMEIIKNGKDAETQKVFVDIMSQIGVTEELSIFDGAAIILTIKGLEEEIRKATEKAFNNHDIKYYDKTDFSEVTYEFSKELISLANDILS